MRNALSILLAASALLALAACRSTPRPGSEAGAAEAAALDEPQEEYGPLWREILFEDLPVLGHRNWIVVADAAFPLQISPGMDIIVSGEDHFAVLDEVLKAVASSKHLRPKVYLDKELDFLIEEMAPGIEACRAKIKERLAGLDVRPVLHEELIARMDQTAKTFKILMIKTDLTLPYTSVFLDLDCGYWPAEAEARLREAMKGK
jgi:hypothetical protein